MENQLPEDAIPLFLSFCIEQYKHANGLTGRQAMETLDSTGTLSYLERHYGVIHTQSPQWILEDINEFINNRKKNDNIISRKC
jgi:hypothetical protein